MPMSRAVFESLAPGYSIRTSDEKLNIDMQNILYDSRDDTFSIQVVYSGQCRYFKIEIFSYEMINQTLKTPLFDPSFQPTNSKAVVIKAMDLELTTSEPNFFRITATEDGATCSSAESYKTYYRFFQRMYVRIFLD